MVCFAIISLVSQSATLAQCLAFRMGLGIGRQVGAEFLPSPDTMHEARPSGHIPSPLRAQLIGLVEELQGRLTGCMDDIVEHDASVMPLWKAHREVRPRVLGRDTAAGA